MARTAIWKSITEALLSDLSEGRYGPGDKLPTEAELSARFAVNRHTVRRALADLSERGLVHARRGAGVFVTHKPTTYAIGRRVRFHRNLRAEGRMPGREMLVLETRSADGTEAEALALPPGAPVHVCEGLSTSDGQVIAYFRSAFPADRLPDIKTHLRAVNSVTEALRREGVEDYTRASTRVAAVPATATLALHLRLNEGAPCLQSTAVNVDPAGRPVEYGRTWFAGDRVTLTLGDEKTP